MSDSNDWLKKRESELVTWTFDFSTYISATPGAVGLTAAQAAAYNTLSDDFIAAYNAAVNPATASPAARQTKRDAKAALIASARELVGIIQKFPGTTNTQRVALGITVPEEKSPIPVPADAPVMDVASTLGWTVEIRLHDASSPTNRGRPNGVAGARIYSFVGPIAPADLNDWEFEGASTLTTIPVEFDVALAPGTKVWLTACWFNPRQQCGPGCAPVSAFISGNAMEQAA